MFFRYIGIDYSGAAASTAPLSGLRVYRGDHEDPPREVLPPTGSSRRWTRQGAARWLLEELRGEVPTIVGMDFSFSFPIQYFEKYSLRRNWFAFLEDFQAHWPTDLEGMTVRDIREGRHGKGDARTGSSRWRRKTEVEAGGAKSVFHFGVPGSVAHSTHAGLVWLLYLKKNLGSRVHVWPFDGWDIPPGKSVIAETWPALWSSDFPTEGRSQDRHDAYSIARWLQMVDSSGQLKGHFSPQVRKTHDELCRLEGWILGVG